MHRELCRQKILSIDIEIENHKKRLATLSPPDAKIVLLRSMLTDLETSRKQLVDELGKIEEAGEFSLERLLEAYALPRVRYG